MCIHLIFWVFWKNWQSIWTNQSVSWTWISNNIHYLCHGLFCIEWFQVRGDCLFWYWLNCWPLFEISFHNLSIILMRAQLLFPFVLFVVMSGILMTVFVWWLLPILLILRMPPELWDKNHKCNTAVPLSPGLVGTEVRCTE